MVTQAMPQERRVSLMFVHALMAEYDLVLAATMFWDTASKLSRDGSTGDPGNRALLTAWPTKLQARHESAPGAIPTNDLRDRRIGDCGSRNRPGIRDNKHSRLARHTRRHGLAPPHSQRTLSPLLRALA
jgi:hypothetical protein